MKLYPIRAHTICRTMRSGSGAAELHYVRAKKFTEELLPGMDLLVHRSFTYKNLWVVTDRFTGLLWPGGGKSEAAAQRSFREELAKKIQEAGGAGKFLKMYIARVAAATVRHGGDLPPTMETVGGKCRCGKRH